MICNLLCTVFESFIKYSQQRVIGYLQYAVTVVQTKWDYVIHTPEKFTVEQFCEYTTVTT